MSRRIPHPRHNGILTIDWLRSRSACSIERILVETVWGKAHKITKASLEKAAVIGCDLDWLAEKLLLSRRSRELYNKAIRRAENRRTRESTEICDAYSITIAAKPEQGESLQRRQRDANSGSWRVLQNTRSRALWNAWQVERKGRR